MAGQLGVLCNRYNVNAIHNIHQSDSFDWLIRYLVKPDAMEWSQCAFIHGLIHADKSIPYESWKESLTALPENIGTFMAQETASWLRGRWRSGQSEGNIDLWLTVEPSSINAGNPQGMRLAVSMPDSDAAQNEQGFESIWNGFTRLFNLLQFLPGGFCVTTEGKEKRAYEALEILLDKPVQPPSTTPGWLDEVIGLADGSLHAALIDLAQRGGPEPVVGYELASTSGAIVGEAELAWEGQHLAVVMPPHAREMFVQMGWKVFTAEEVVGDPSLLGILVKEA